MKKSTENKPSKLNKKKILKASAITLATLAVIVGTLIPSAGEVVSQNPIADPPAIVLNLEEEAIVEEEEPIIQSRKSNRISANLKTWVLGLPRAIRVVFVLPLWGLGWVITSGASLLWSGLFSPALGFVASWIIGAAVLLGLFASTAKMLFPQLSFKKILSKKNIYIVAAAALTIVAIDTVAPFYWEDYRMTANLIKVVFSVGIVSLLIYRLKKKYSAILS